MKKVIVLEIILILMVNMMVSSADITNELKAVVAPFKIIVDREEKAFEMPIIVINGRTYLPLRETAETLGIGIDWIAEEKTIVVSTKKEEEFFEEIDFPYEVNFIVMFMERGYQTYYNMVIESDAGSVKLRVDYNDKDHDYASDPDFWAVLGDIREVKYKYSEEKRITLEQCNKIIDLISKDEIYEIEDETDVMLSVIPITDTEGAVLFVKDTHSNKLNEASFSERSYHKRDENLKKLVKMLVELSPVEIVNKEGKLPAFMAE